MLLVVVLFQSVSSPDAESSIPINIVMATPPHQSEDQMRPKLCLLVKKTADEEYGFNLHAEKDKGSFMFYSNDFIA